MSKANKLSNGIIVETTPSAKLEKVADGSMRDAHLRNSYTLHKRFGMPLIFSEEQMLFYADKVKDLEYICVSYGSFYCPFRAMNKLIEAHPNAKLIWITNEIEISPPGLVHKQMERADIIANFVESPNHKWKRWHFLNLNTLMVSEKNPLMRKKYDAIYYGTYRKDRTKYFRKYLQKDLYLSTNSKNHKKYKHIGCDPKRIGALEWKKGMETLNLFRYSLYIEDEQTHKRFNNLANRFYEALFCNTVTLFDRSCKNTIEKSGIPFDEDFYVDSYEELNAKIRDGRWEQRLVEQQKWLSKALEEKEEVIEKIGKIFINDL